MGLVLSHSVSETPFANLTDVTLADEDTNAILTDNANRAIQGNMAMHVTLPGGQLWNQCKWWPNLQPMQVVPSGGQICNQCKWRHLVAKIGTNASVAIWWLNLQLK